MLQKGILSETKLPAKAFQDQWDKIFVPDETKTRLLCQGLLEYTLRGQFSSTSVPLHGIILLAGPPGTGKTSLARGLANRIAQSLNGSFRFVEIDPHSLASSSLGRSQQAVRDLLQKTVSELASQGPLIVLLDEVETLATDRRRLSLDANPIDVHRATDAVLTGVDLLAAQHPHLLFIATTNFHDAVDEALLSRADHVEWFGKPDEFACTAILRDTLDVLASRWHALSKLAKHPRFQAAVGECVGLDAREIRKAVIAACAFSTETALNPGLLTIDDLLRSVRQVKTKRESK